MKEITTFALMQPEAAVVRHDLEDEYGPAATPEFRASFEQEKADREAAKHAKLAQNRKMQERRRKRDSRRDAKAREAATTAGDPDRKDEV